MKLKPQSYILKSGDQINIRVPEVNEAQKLLDLKRGYIKNTKTLPLILEEYPDDVEKEARLITEYETSSNSILLIAECNGVFVGNIDLTGNKRNKMAHTGMLGMGIKETWRNQGLGKLLINSVMDWCRTQSKIKIVWLDVYASNASGYHLYSETGFEVCGTIKNFFKEGERYIDKIQMIQYVH